MRLALKVVMQNDRDFVDVILLDSSSHLITYGLFARGRRGKLVGDRGSTARRPPGLLCPLQKYSSDCVKVLTAQ